MAYHFKEEVEVKVKVEVEGGGYENL